MNSFCLYGITFEYLSQDTAIEKIKSALKEHKTIRVFTPNLEMLSDASKSTSAQELLNSAELLLPDGIGVSLICRKNGIAPPPRITGIDTALSMLKYISLSGDGVFLLGGAPGVAEKAAQELRQKFPSLKICGTHHGYFDVAADSAENARVVETIHRAAPTVLLVCMGYPRQEKWILQNTDELPTVSIFMGLGGSLDVWAGKVRRAPIIVQKIRLEWLWRCILQPSRIPKLFKSAFRIIFR